MVGLDIGTTTIKVVELAKEGNVWRFRGSGIVRNPINSPENLRDDKEASGLAAVIKKLFADAKISSKDVAVCLPEPQVFTRTIRFPYLTDQEVASAIKWEAEQYIPIPLSEAIVQHEVISRRQDTVPPEVLVLLVAAPRAVVEKYVKVVQSAGLSPVHLETGLISLSRCLGIPDKTVLIVEFGAKTTDIAIARNCQLVFSRSIQTAGDALTRAIARELSVDYQQAEQYKRTYGLSADKLEGKIRNIILPVLGTVTDEIKKALHYYQVEEKGEVPQTLVLTGGSSDLPEAISYFTSSLNLEVVVGNPFAGIVIDSQVAKSVSPYSSLYSQAVGLAKSVE